jgi:hypothetical protein
MNSTTKQLLSKKFKINDKFASMIKQLKKLNKQIENFEFNFKPQN